VKRVLRSITTVIVLVSFTGCTTWTATQAPLRDLDGKKVRVTTRNDDVHEGLLMHPDTLGSRILIRGDDPSVLLIVDSSEVMKIETRKAHAGRTAGLVLLGVGVAATVGLIYVISVFNDPDY
jgi:hypothetical protein